MPTLVLLVLWVLSATKTGTLSLTESFSQTNSITKSLSQSKSESMSSSVSLSDTFSLSIPTGTLTFSSSPTFSISKSDSFSKTVSLSIPTGSVSHSSSLSFTVSLSLPTATQTISESLPTATESFSSSKSFSSSLTESVSLTISMSLPTGSVSFSKSLTFSYSLTETFSLSETFSESLTFSLSLPTASATFSSSITWSVSLTSSDSLTLSKSLTLSMSLTIPTLSVTASLPTGTMTSSQTITETISLPTGTNSLSLPTSSGSVSLSESESRTSSVSNSEELSQSLSLTITKSLSLATHSETYSLSLPTHSRTVSFSLPTGTASQSFSLTKSLSLPTATVTTSQTETVSVTLSLPTVTLSLSKSFSLTKTDSVSLTKSISLSESVSQTRITQTNYSIAVEPKTFIEGQEFRIRMKAQFGDDDIKRFDSLNKENIKLELYEHKSDIGLDCNMYVSSQPALWKCEDRIGFDSGERESGDRFVLNIYCTVVAPENSFRFIICFKHNLDISWDVDPFRGWQPLPITETPEIQTLYTLQSIPTRVNYYLPDPTSSQYAIIQLLSSEDGWNFTYPQSQLCGRKGRLTLACGEGDSLKIVRKGSSCTKERILSDSHPYYGSQYIDRSNGNWIDDDLFTLTESATPGGVGLFGTRHGNPLVDSWQNSGLYPQYDSIKSPSKENEYFDKESFVYVKLPKRIPILFDAQDRNINFYEICFSSREQRMSWSRENETIISVPMWRKLYSTSGVTSFEVKSEPVGWSAFDLTPESWATVVFDDSTEGKLSSHQAVSNPSIGSSSSLSPVFNSISLYDYFENTISGEGLSGGDFFRLVRTDHFTETDRTGISNGTLFYGSTPSVGCWYSNLDDLPVDKNSFGGFAEQLAKYPIGSANLNGDPSNLTSDNDAEDRKTVFSTIWIPPPSSHDYYVCYRRSCRLSNCPTSSGMRVLPWHGGVNYNPISNRNPMDKVMGDPPMKWIHAKTITSKRETISNAIHDGRLHSASGDLINDVYPEVLPPSQKQQNQAMRFSNVDIDRRYPPSVHSLQAYLNDTRMGTWGPIKLSSFNQSDMFDSRPWNFHRKYNKTDGVEFTIGSAIRLVPSNMPCESLVQNNLTFMLSSSKEGQQFDGGNVECSNSLALIDEKLCSGTSFDSEASSEIYFYIMLPSDPGEYSVCFRHRGWNWVELSDKIIFKITTDLPSLQFGDNRSGMQSLFIITDPMMRGSAEPFNNNGMGDIFRIVCEDCRCDINPMSWRNTSRISTSDFHLSPFCYSEGYGTISSSGVFSPPCSLSSVVSNELNGIREHVATSSGELFDDLVPYDSPLGSNNLPATAAFVTLPPPGRYLLCYRQQTSFNWVVLNPSFNIVAGPTSETSLSILSPLEQGELGSEQLVAGSALEFSFGKFKYYYLIYFMMKFVFVSNLDNSNCINPGVGTEGQPIVSYANTSLITSADHPLSEKATFAATVPSRPGAYILCVMTDNMFSWQVPRSLAYSYTYYVIDNNIRWFVLKGGLPVEQGTVKIFIVRLDNEIIDPTHHEVKIIEKTLSRENPLLLDCRWGKDINRLKSNLEKTGSDYFFNANLPKQSNLKNQRYTICYKISNTWIEVEQRKPSIKNQQIFIKDHSGRSILMANKSPISSWSHGLLSPYTGILSGGNLLVAGVPVLDTDRCLSLNIADEYLNVFSSVNVTSSKLIFTPKINKFLKTGQLLRDPCDYPGDVKSHLFEIVRSSNSKLFIKTHLPIKEGSYHFCFQIDPFSPWLWLTRDDGTTDISIIDNSIYAVVSYETGVFTTTLLDLSSRETTDGLQSNASWCKNNRCLLEGYTTDLVSFREDSVNCDSPVSAPLGSLQSPPEWYQLNSSSRIEETTVTTSQSLILPSFVDDHQFVRVCLFKISSIGNYSHRGSVFHVPLFGDKSPYWDSKPSSQIEFNVSLVSSPVLHQGETLNFNVDLSGFELGSLLTVLQCSDVNCSSLQEFGEGIGYFDVEIKTSVIFQSDVEQNHSSDRCEVFSDRGMTSVRTAEHNLISVIPKTNCNPLCGIVLSIASPISESFPFRSKPYWYRLQEQSTETLSANSVIITPEHGTLRPANLACDQTTSHNCYVVQCVEYIKCSLVVQSIRKSSPLVSAYGGIYFEQLQITTSQWIPPPEVRDRSKVMFSKDGSVLLNKTFIPNQNQTFGVVGVIRYPHRIWFQSAVNNSQLWDSIFVDFLVSPLHVTSIVVTSVVPVNLRDISLVGNVSVSDKNNPVYDLPLDYYLEAGKSYRLTHSSIVMTSSGIELPVPSDIKLKIIGATLPRAGNSINIINTGSNWIEFSVENNVGCLRADGGCVMLFKVERSEVDIQLRAAVRVAGLEARWYTDKLIDSNSKGVTITVEVGTWCGTSCWAPDEYHQGAVFVLFANSNDGIYNVEGTKILTPADTISSLKTLHYLKWNTSLKKMIATITIHTSDYVTDAELTLHSTLGAGPGIGSYKHQLFITLTDGYHGIVCDIPIQPSLSNVPVDKTIIRVTAVHNTTFEPSLFPRWPLSLELTSVGIPIYEQSKLSEFGLIEIKVPWSTTIKVTAKISSTENRSCEVRTPDQPVTVKTDKPLIVSSDMMSVETPKSTFYSFKTDTATLSSGRLIMIQTLEGDPLPGPLVIKPRGGPATKNIGALLPVPVEVSLDSEYNVGLPLEDISFGSLLLNVEEGVTTKQNFAAIRVSGATPVRKAIFEICGSSGVGSCVEIHLTITTNMFDLQIIVLSLSPRSGLLTAGGTDCYDDYNNQPTPITVTVAAHYRMEGIQSLTRYYLSDVEIKYEIRSVNPLQVFEILSSSLTRENPTSEKYNYSNTGVKTIIGMSELDGRWTSNFIGKINCESTQLIISATATSNGSHIPIADAAIGPYSWSYPSRRYESWEVLSSIKYLDGCRIASQSIMYPTSSVNYLTEDRFAHSGWRFFDDFYAGVPTPIQIIIYGTGNKRAWGYSGTNIRVTRSHQTGCGGSTPITVTTQDGILFPGGMVPVHSGIATAWVTFKEPCGECKLSIDLCYSTAVVSSDCLRSPNAVKAEDQIPIIAARQFTTSPFSVKAGNVNSVLVSSQTLPMENSKQETVTVHTSDRFSVTVGLYQLIDNRAIHATSSRIEVDVQIRSIWNPSFNPNGELLKYGNGGFLSSHVGSSCGDLNIENHNFITKKASSGNVQFEFTYTKTCSQCLLWVYYKIKTPSGNQQWSSFPLRHRETDSIYKITVLTCAALWVVPPNIRRTVVAGEYFTMSLWKVNYGGHPSWDGYDLFSFTVQHRYGNGEGGLFIISSPIVVGSNNKVAAAFGVLTVRLLFTRSCFLCVIAASWDGGVIYFPITVVEQPVSIKSIFSSNSGSYTSEVNKYTVTHYASNMYGDRAVLYGGPTVPNRQRFDLTSRTEPVHSQVTERRSSQIGVYDESGRGFHLINITALNISFNGGELIFWDGVGLQHVTDRNTTLTGSDFTTTTVFEISSGTHNNGSVIPAGGVSKQSMSVLNNDNKLIFVTVPVTGVKLGIYSDSESVSNSGIVLSPGVPTDYVILLLDEFNRISVVTDVTLFSIDSSACSTNSSSIPGNGCGFTRVSSMMWMRLTNVYDGDNDQIGLRLESNLAVGHDSDCYCHVSVSYYENGKTVSSLVIPVLLRPPSEVVLTWSVPESAAGSTFMINHQISFKLLLVDSASRKLATPTIIGSIKLISEPKNCFKMTQSTSVKGGFVISGYFVFVTGDVCSIINSVGIHPSMLLLNSQPFLFRVSTFDYNAESGIGLFVPPEQRHFHRELFPIRLTEGLKSIAGVISPVAVVGRFVGVLFEKFVASNLTQTLKCVSLHATVINTSVSSNGSLLLGVTIPVSGNYSCQLDIQAVTKSGLLSVSTEVESFVAIVLPSDVTISFLTHFGTPRERSLSADEFKHKPYAWVAGYQLSLFVKVVGTDGKGYFPKEEMLRKVMFRTQSIPCLEGWEDTFNNHCGKIGNYISGTCSILNNSILQSSPPHGCEDMFWGTTTIQLNSSGEGLVKLIHSGGYNMKEIPILSNIQVSLERYITTPLGDGVITLPIKIDRIRLLTLDCLYCNQAERPQIPEGRYPVDISVLLKDEFGKIVVADSDSILQIRATCGGQPHSVSLVIVSGIGGRELIQKNTSVSGWYDLPTNRGKGILPNASFTGSCYDGAIEARCLLDGEIDRFGWCSDLRFVLNVSFGNWSVKPPPTTSAPMSSNPVVQVTLWGISQSTFDEQEFSAKLGLDLIGALQTSVSVVVRYLCRVILEKGSPIPITDNDRLNSSICKVFDSSSGSHSRFVHSLTTTNYTFIVEFEVQSAGDVVTDADFTSAVQTVLETPGNTIRTAYPGLATQPLFVILPTSVPTGVPTYAATDVPISTNASNQITDIPFVSVSTPIPTIEIIPVPSTASLLKNVSEVSSVVCLLLFTLIIT